MKRYERWVYLCLGICVGCLLTVGGLLLMEMLTDWEALKQADPVSDVIAAPGASAGGGDAAQQGLTEGPRLRIAEEPQVYTYEDMEQDLRTMQQMYPELMTVESMGRTLDGRELYHVVIGEATAEKRVLIHAGIHAREYVTSQLVMKQMADFLDRLQRNESYGGLTYAELMERCALHIVPMVNPDGIALSQQGLSGVRTQEAWNSVLKIALEDEEKAEGQYLREWKSNMNGVDLNRNFDALWEEYSDRVGRPSSMRYKGESPGCEPESAALIRLTEAQEFDRTISYHAQGSEIYWYFGQDGEVYEATKAFGERIAAATGYRLAEKSSKLDPAGYKDWAISKLGIPSLTIEVGRDTTPVPAQQFPRIWQENRCVWQEALLDCVENE